MTWVAVAIGGSALLGAYSSSKAASTQADAVNNASNTQAQAAREAAQLQKDMFDKQVELQAPFRAGGLAGQNRLMELLGLGGNAGAAGYGSATQPFSMTDFQQDPGYAWRLQQGQQAIERSAAARGGLGSGRMAKDLTNYAQGAASQEYGNAYNRFQTNRANLLNPLQSLAGQAQSSANTLGGAAQNYGNVGSANLTNAGNAQASNLIAGGNANASGYMGTANAISGGVGQGLNYFQNQNMVNRLFPQAGSGYVPPIQDNGYSFGTGSAYGGQRAGL